MKFNDILVSVAIAAVAGVILALVIWGVAWTRAHRAPLETGLCPVEVVLPLPRGGEIRYHAELSCVELDAMAREEVDNDAAIR